MGCGWWFSDVSRDLSTRLFKDWVDLFETAKAQQILKNVPTPLLLNSFGGSVRETANMLRSGTLTRTADHLAMAFGLCWGASYGLNVLSRRTPRESGRPSSP